MAFMFFRDVAETAVRKPHFTGNVKCACLPVRLFNKLKAQTSKCMSQTHTNTHTLSLALSANIKESVFETCVIFSAPYSCPSEMT